MEGEHDDTVVETEDEIVEVENQDQEDAAPALETPGTDSADPVDDDGPEGQGRKTRKRIEGLLGDKAELRGHLDASQAENARLRQEIANKDTPAPTPEPKLTRPEPPTLEQFEGDFDRFTVAQNQFTQDLIAFDRQEADARAETKAAETARTNRENTRRAEQDERWAGQIDAGRERHGDYDVVAFNRDLPISPEMGEAIKESENGGEVYYFLGKNPDRARRISVMNPTQAALEIGRISNMVGTKEGDGKQAGGGKTLSSAPAPAKPAKGTAGAPQTDPSKMSQQEFNEFRNGGGGT